MENFLKNNKKNQIFFGVILVILLGVISFFAYIKITDYLAEKKISVINKVLEKNEINRDSCKTILDFDKLTVKEGNKYFNENKFDSFNNSCDLDYNIVNQKIELEFCEKIIKGNKENFNNIFIILKDFENIREKCTLKFLTAKFGTGTFFNPENDFKSTINLDFSLPFFTDIGVENSDEFIENRINSKKRLVDLLIIKPKIEFDENNVVLYNKKAILYLPLTPETDYEFSLKSFDSGLDLEKVKTELLSFKTPENKFFGILKKEKVSLFRDTMSPSLKLVSYNLNKTSTEVKICRIDNETYAKIEVFNETKGLIKEKKEFFKSGIDNLKTFECKTKTISLDKIGNDSLLIKKEFNFDDLIGKPARSGLYYVTFANQLDRELNNRVQSPIFFGIIDSHITMKISRNGEAFFFVNDFNGKPLAKQNIRLYLNDFKSKDSKWDRNKKEYINNYFSPLETNVFDEAVLLGLTGNDGVLKVNIKDKIDNAFYKTFESYDYDWNGSVDGFFITSASDNNLTYVSSKWNGGIAPWNFGYSVGSSWWGNNRSENSDEISMNRWGNIEPILYSHIYTDRKLYLPGEELFIKGILRNSKDLSIPENKEVNIKISNSQGDELLNKDIFISEFGSISEKLNLSKESKLGNYNIILSYEGIKVGQSGFSVEVFKNPKFKNEIMLESKGLNESLVKITKTKKETTSWGYERKTFKGNFDIKATIFSKYYSGSPVKNAKFTYKVYKQYYYDNSYWDDCYYGCYWEPQKEFYTEGKGILDNNGKASFDIPVEFSSNYSDYKYIVEATITDNIGDKISGTNSIIAKLPSDYKRWDPNSGIYFKSEKRFYEVGKNITIDGGLSVGKFNSDYNDKFLLIIKKKEYSSKEVNDVRGYTKTISSSKEIIEDILEVNNKNFSLGIDGKLKFNYKLKETGEYIFEFGKLNTKLFFDVNGLVKEFKKTKDKYIKKDFSGKIKVTWENVANLLKYCDSDKSSCLRKDIVKQLGCREDYVGKSCRNLDKNITLSQKFKVDDLINPDNRKYFTIISHGNKLSNNPIENDNKITVLSEKVSYKLGEKARILVRLPFSKGKILWTIEKQGVLKHEYIDVPGNTFFKEFIIDDTYIPNAYIGLVAVDINNKEIPEYKVGYTEVVVDKSDKKTFIEIKSNKKEYKPREEVNLDIKVKDNIGKGKKSELTLMVVDDSLISLMGNVDLNTLEKFYKKLPFQIQTSITNIAMLRNYYFSRKGIVGGSGFGNFKGGDSAVSSRNIFKNTAYYNASIITDNFGNAKINFTLPDNLTNFRVMVISNSKDNFFGYSEEFIEVRKEVLVEPRVPLILRGGDEIELTTNIFNNTDKEIGFKASLVSSKLLIDKSEQNIKIGAGKNIVVTWKVIAPKNISADEIEYMITILGDTVEHSDKIEGTIKMEQSPILIQNNLKSENISEGENKSLTLELNDNTDISKSKYELYISKNPLNGIEKIISSLAKYPYGCIEQTVSSTMPNAILKKFSNIKVDSGVSDKAIENNLNYGIERISSMQQKSGGFSYWQGETNVNDSITPYVLRSLIEIKEFGGKVSPEMINKSVKYLENIYSKSSINLKPEILWALAKNYNNKNITNNLSIENLTDNFNFSNMSRHELIAHTYSMILTDKVKYKLDIESNIQKIKLFVNSNNGNYYYSNNTQDKAIFAQLLLDYGDEKSYTYELIKDLYNYDWDSYYYSTKTKNEVFKAFIKYIENNSSNNDVKVKFILNGLEKEFLLNSKDNSYKYNISLDKVLKDNKVNLKIENIEGNPIFVSTNIISYPKDIKKVPEYSNKLDIKREIFEVVDETKIEEKCRWIYNDSIRGKNNEWVCDKAEGLKLHISDKFKKGVTYKIKLTSILEDGKNRQNFVVEDYLPSGFSILNSKFKTNSIATNQETTSTRSWRWDYTENNPGVVMAHAKNIWRNTATYEYFIRADFTGKFVYPPSTGYMMYNPKIRANSKYREIEIIK